MQNVIYLGGLDKKSSPLGYRARSSNISVLNTFQINLASKKMALLVVGSTTRNWVKVVGSITNVLAVGRGGEGLWSWAFACKTIQVRSTCWLMMGSKKFTITVSCWIYVSYNFWYLFWANLQLSFLKSHLLGGIVCNSGSRSHGILISRF